MISTTTTGLEKFSVNPEIIWELKSGKTYVYTQTVSNKKERVKLADSILSFFCWSEIIYAYMIKIFTS